MRKSASVSTCVNRAGDFSQAQARCPVSPFAQRFGSFSHSRGWVGVRERRTIDFSVYQTACPESSCRTHLQQRHRNRQRHLLLSPFEQLGLQCRSGLGLSYQYCGQGRAGQGNQRRRYNYWNLLARIPKQPQFQRDSCLPLSH